MYSSELGRFISRDPIGYADGWNLYAGYFASHWGMDPSGNKSKKKPKLPLGPKDGDGCEPCEGETQCNMTWEISLTKREQVNGVWGDVTRSSGQRLKAKLVNLKIKKPKMCHLISYVWWTCTWGLARPATPKLTPADWPKGWRRNKKKSKWLSPFFNHKFDPFEEERGTSNIFISVQIEHLSCEKKGKEWKWKRKTFLDMISAGDHAKWSTRQNTWLRNPTHRKTSGKTK